ncbi:MAG: cysteine-rich small domain-containing protein [Lentihominibacter sp.]
MNNREDIINEEEFAFFMQNRNCKYFPCHECSNPDSFNCMFCYCPMYMLGEKCGGDFTYTDQGIKDCSNCTILHDKDAHHLVKSKFMLITAYAGRKERMKGRK